MTTINTLTQENNIEVIGYSENLRVDINTIYNNNSTVIYAINFEADEPLIPEPITIKWKIPAHNIKGIWKPTTDFSKRIQADWELKPMESRISIDSPVISLFGNQDENRHTFACSNAINKLELDAVIREEDDCFYCSIKLFVERHSNLKEYTVQVRLDSGEKHFSQAIKEVASWWETFDHLKPASIPEIAQAPLYSTWYQFHQNLSEKVLLEECKIAYDLGYKVIIVDDGWQTNDNNRGYDYTGDWQPERLPQMRTFVDHVHATGMKVGLWYSVPFCGKYSDAYQQFKGKFLTENHRWAPVFDPRYPEVRNYLINIYKNALIEWNLDGFKLDFIDDFKLYHDTSKEKNEDMDYHSINEAVDRLLTDVKNTLYAINPDIFIEFRQKYTGPAMRKYGNMFRAFDCPGDATMNRVRIADIKMLAGDTAVHSDMITWHNDEALEVAALQLVNTLFGVPQISVRLKNLPESHLEMIRFYTSYWNENKDIITTGNFKPSRPLSNYPIKKVVKDEKLIIGAYDNYIIELKAYFNTIDIINGKLSTSVVMKNEHNFGEFKLSIYNCKGEKVNDTDQKLEKGLQEFTVPACGLIRLIKK